MGGARILIGGAFQMWFDESIKLACVPNRGLTGEGASLVRIIEIVLMQCVNKKANF